MPTVTFKAKPQNVFTADDVLSDRFIKIPKLTRGHCDMAAFRTHPKFGSYANSDFFESILKRALMARGIGPNIFLNRELPSGVSVDASGFLATVTIELDDWR